MIIRDKDLSHQGITNIKHFTPKKDGTIIKLNRYLITFNSTSVPDHIFISPYRMRVDIFIPDPTRCFKCQKFRHSKTQCTGGLVCFHCSEDQEGFDCNKEIKCCNCGEAHMASSKEIVISKSKLFLCKLLTSFRGLRQEKRGARQILLLKI